MSEIKPEPTYEPPRAESLEGSDDLAVTAAGVVPTDSQ